VPVAIVAGRRARILEHSCAENDVNDQNVRSAPAQIPSRPALGRVESPAETTPAPGFPGRRSAGWWVRAQASCHQDVPSRTKVCTPAGRPAGNQRAHPSSTARKRTAYPDGPPLRPRRRAAGRTRLLA